MDGVSGEEEMQRANGSGNGGALLQKKGNKKIKKNTMLAFSSSTDSLHIPFLPSFPASHFLISCCHFFSPIFAISGGGISTNLEMHNNTTTSRESQIGCK